MPPLLDFVRDVVSRLFAPAPAAAETRLVRLADRLQDCLDFHRPRFAEVGIADEAAVVRELQNKKLVHEQSIRQVESNVLADLVLAQACCAETQPSKRELLDRFEARLDQLLQASLGTIQGRHYADERPDIWTICSKERPLKQTPLLDDYHGRTFLWAWLRPIVLRLAYQWRQRVEREAAAKEKLSYESPQCTRLTAEQIVTEAEQMSTLDPAVLTKVVQEVLKRLTLEEQFYLYWVIIENRSKKTFAKLLGIKDYDVTRKYVPLEARLPALVLEVAEDLNCYDELITCLQAALQDKDAEAYSWFHTYARDWQQQMSQRIADLEPQA